MAKRQTIFQYLMAVGLILGLLADPWAALAGQDVYFSASQLQSGDEKAARQTNLEIPETFELLAENELFVLYADPATLAFKVLDQRSGYIWHSNLDEKAPTDKLNKTWTAFASSGISIDYLDVKAIGKRASVTTANHTIDFKRTAQGFEAVISFTDVAITLVVIVQLEPNGVSVEVPFDLIKEETSDFKLGLLHLYPFMGATRADSVPGYMFIPDGSGSLIDFGATTKATNMFYGRYYGADLGMITFLPYDPTQNRPHKISIPVTGMVHGPKQNAYIAIVEKGASYAEINAHPAGIITNFNFLYNTFVYNESFFQATNRSGAGVTTLQRKTNAFDIKIHYRFLTQDDSDYVGMARSYQQYLVERGALKKSVVANSDIGIRLEFLGGEKERVLFWQRLISMTTIEQMAEILNGLDVKNPEVIYYGWQPLGASAMPPKSFQIDRSLGSPAQLKVLMEAIAARGGNLSLYLDPQAALWEESGYSTRHDLAMSITNFNLIGYNRDKVNYFLNFAAISKNYATLSREIFSGSKAGLALDGIGSNLYSDFKNNNFLSREESIQKYQSLLAEYPGRTSFYLPNDYVFGSMQAYYDIPLADSGYIYTTEAVPFIEIVLAGYVPYYGAALNFSSNLQEDLLRHADYGVYPSFFLSYEVTAKILKTNSSWIYTSAYSQWDHKIEAAYQWLNNLLGPVKGQSIVAREALAEGVIATTYSNGNQIIVNFTETPFLAGDLMVNSKDAVIREALP